MVDLMRGLAKSVADALNFLHEVANDVVQLPLLDDATRSYFQAGLSVFLKPDFESHAYAVVGLSDGPMQVH